MEPDALRLVSWNVAGWDSTLRYIRAHYSTLDEYLRRLGADIVAVQEVKLTRQKVSAEPAAVCAHITPDGWESFWCFPATEGRPSASAAKRGFNGCTTFSRAGLTIAADPAPLGDPELDGEGRCLLTDHGGFVLLNVYAHATGGEGAEYEARLARKLRFFRALSAKMERLRADGRKVVLCGDLNVAARGRDVPWRQALLPLSSLSLPREAEGDPSVVTNLEPGQNLTSSPGAACLPRDDETAASSFSVPSPSPRSATAATERLHAALGGAVGVEALIQRLPAGGSRGVVACGRVLKAVADVLANPNANPELFQESQPDTSAPPREPRASVDHEGAADVEEDSREAADEDDEGVNGAVEEGENASGGTAGGGGTPAQPSPLQQATSALRELSHAVGISPSQRDCVGWFESLMTDHGMVDTFASLRPNARHRFTCWWLHQHSCPRSLDRPSLEHLSASA